MGGYQLEQMPEITEDTLITLGCSSTSTGGSGGGVFESLVEGNFPVFVSDYLLRNEAKSLERRCYPSDRELLRLTYQCGNSWDLKEVMRSFLDGKVDLDKSYGSALYMFLTGSTTASNFNKVWAL